MANPYPALLDLDTVAAGEGGFKIQGETANDVAAGSIGAAGDVNGDGRPDLVVSAGGNDSGGSNAGAAYVIFGREAGFPALVDLDQVAAGTGGFKIQGQAAGDIAGRSVAAAGDLNGDGRGDLIVGASGQGADAGAAYVVYGKAGGALVDLNAVAAGSGGFRILGEARGDLAGWSVAAAGDVNGDGVADLLIGASGNNAGGLNAGAAYVVFGQGGGLGPLVRLTSIASGAGGFKIQGENAGDLAGVSVASVGDLDGDGLADLLVGASGNNAGGANAGAAYVVFGKADGALVDLDAVAAGVGGFKIQGENAGDLAGRSVAAAGDVNNDGVTDLVIGAGGNNGGGANAGAAYVVFGNAAGLGPVVDLDVVGQGVGGFKIQGEAAGDLAGAAVAGAGDVNGDGFADLLVAARGNDTGGVNAGAAYLVYGRAYGFATPVDLDLIATGVGGFKIQGENPGDLAGRSVAAAGDLDGDGFADLLIGASGNDSGGNDAGAAYVVYGRAETITEQVDSAGGTQGDDVVDLLGGDDYFFGKAGNDRVTGNAGADWLRGAGGDDTFVLGGSSGPDLVAGSNARARNADMVSSDGVFDTRRIAGRAVTLDTLDGGAGDDRVEGTSGADVIIHDAARLAVFAGQNPSLRLASIERFDLGGGDDVLDLTTAGTAKYVVSVVATGGAGNDALWGGSGDDELQGGGGDDYLVGGIGDDVLTGGAGSDLFGFAEGFGNDVVTDFTQGEDRLRIKGFDVTALDAPGITIDRVGADTVITLTDDTTVTITLRGFTGTLTADDVVLVA